MAQTFACPNCTASLDYDGGNHLTQKCPYCNSTVIIPENLRPRAHQQDFAPLLAKQQGVQRVVHLLNHDQMEEAIQLYMDTFGVDLNQAADAVERLAAGLSLASQHVTTIHLNPQGTRRMGCWITAVILLLTFGVIAAVLIPTMGGLAAVWALVQGGDTLEEGVGSVIEAIEDGEVPGLSGTPILEIPEVSATQTPTAAEVVFEVGERGINPGQFNDARAVAVDETGTIYVADRDSGRFQIFAADGSFQSLLPWDDSSFTSDLAIAPNSNEFYAIFGSHIYRYDRTTGEQLGEIVYADSVGSTFRGLATAVNGDILAINGSPRTLVRFDAAGNLLFAVSVEDIPSAIFFEDVAVDGLGNLYVTGTAEDALGDRQDVVFKFTAEGQLISQFGQSGREPGTFMGTVSAITVDGQGHIYVSDFQGIQIFDNNGRYLDIIKLDGIAFQMAFNQDGELIAISNQEKLYKFAINELGN